MLPGQVHIGSFISKDGGIREWLKKAQDSLFCAYFGCSISK